MTYPIDQAYGKQPREYMRKIFDRDAIERDISRAKEDLGEIALYLREAEAQLDLIKATPLKWFIELRRQKNYGTGHTNITIHPYQLPDLPDAEKIAMKMYEHRPGVDKDKGTMNNPFLGNEKKAAVQAALLASARHGHCPIVGTGADLIPKQQEIIEIP